ncbi:ATP-binding protein [Agrobacterium vitis]|uniref:ATP-binding protein n=1 Tax=Agrobacterium vitis TaxID=373 RepID=UPI003B527703
MQNPDLPFPGSALSTPSAGQDRRDQMTPGNRFLGRVVACNGARATIAATAQEGGTDLTSLWSVGRLISITVGENRVVALVYAMRTETGLWSEDRDNGFIVDVELMGEVCRGPDGSEVFTSGITQYPYLGAIAHRIRVADLKRIYDSKEGGSCKIGRLSQDDSIDATIHIPSMLSKHFAVVGSTGVGKSTAVSLLLHKAIAADPKLRVLILDPHNEFAAAFGNQAVVIDTDTLDLPFWLMRLDELTEVLYRGRPAVVEELDVLRDLIPEAKRAFKGSEAGLTRRSERAGFTADTPVPYRLSDLLAAIDERIGRLEGRDEKPALRSLKMRIMSAVNDPRYRFMFSSNTISDTIMETVAHIFRVPGHGKPISTFQLAGIPSEIVNSVASVLCRMAFELALWSNGAIHMLVVCEEAHRYVPADPSLGFFPTRQAIARIAKEGRKYGVSLGIITQRPGELDQTILSQCSTVFAMRLSNDSDQAIIRKALPDSSISATSFISSIGNGEAIAFGEAIAVPMRMRFDRVEQRHLPKASGSTLAPSEDMPDNIDLSEVISRMRASAEPDISGFQQSYRVPEPEAYRPPAPNPEPTIASPLAEPFHAPTVEPPEAPRPILPSPPIEPYRPDMLPGTELGTSPAAPRPEPASGFRPASAYAGLRKPDAQTLFAAAPSPAVPPRRDTGMSLRESILKKPLGGLKD